MMPNGLRAQPSMKRTGSGTSENGFGCPAAGRGERMAERRYFVAPPDLDPALRFWALPLRDRTFDDAIRFMINILDLDGVPNTARRWSIARLDDGPHLLVEW